MLEFESICKVGLFVSLWEEQFTKSAWGGHESPQEIFWITRAAPRRATWMNQKPPWYEQGMRPCFCPKAIFHGRTRFDSVWFDLIEGLLMLSSTLRGSNRRQKKIISHAGKKRDYGSQRKKLQCTTRMSGETPHDLHKTEMRTIVGAERIRSERLPYRHEGEGDHRPRRWRWRWRWRWQRCRRRRPCVGWLQPVLVGEGSQLLPRHPAAAAAAGTELRR